MKNLLIAVMCLGAALFSGCVALPPDSTAVQGTWKGQEVVNGQAEISWLTITESRLEFHGASPNEWYKGNYTLISNARPKQLIVQITQSSVAQAVGKTANAIYEFIPGPNDQDTLIITGNEPGNPQMPAGFGDRRARQIVFTRN